MESVTLVLPYPISANRYWASRVVTPRGGRPMAITYVTEYAREYKLQISKIAQAAGFNQPFPWRVTVRYELFPARPLDWAKRAARNPIGWDDDVRCIDVGNAHKVLEDALIGIAYPDDKWIWELSGKRMEPDGEARVVVSIAPIRVESPQPGLI